MIRIWVAVQDRDRRAALIRMLRTDPTVRLVGSEAEADIVKSYALHANCYICKPVDLTQFIRVVKSIDEFWLAVCKLPSA